MKANLLPAIVLAIAITAFGLADSAQDRPNRSAMIAACAEANRLIPELIELAPYGTGWVNRTQAWFENLLEVIGDLFSWMSNTQRKGELSQVGKAVIRVDITHTFLHFDLRTIMNANREVVEDIMPSKLRSPVDYISGLTTLRQAIVDPEYKRFLGERK